jgi:hypothetical protein
MRAAGSGAARRMKATDVRGSAWNQLISSDAFVR